MKVQAINKRAPFDYFLRSFYEAGVVLLGHEVRSIKTGHISIKNSFVTVKDSELYLTNADIPPYVHAGNLRDYNPTRPRKLLLHAKEIASLIGKSKAEGATLIPTKLYLKKGKVKIEIAVAFGKKQYDKRQTVAKRESDRSIRRALKF